MKTEDLRKELKSYLSSRESLNTEMTAYIDKRMPENHVESALKYIKEERIKEPNALITELGVDEKRNLFINII